MGMERRRMPPAATTKRRWIWINDATKPLILALAPRVAARVAVGAAVAADRGVAELSEELLAANEHTGNYINVLRADHRREHLDEIEEARSRR